MDDELKKGSNIEDGKPVVPPSEEPALDALLGFLKQNRNFDFNAYKRYNLARHLRRRTETLHLPGYAAYHDYLRAHPDEFTHLFNTLMIPITAFFRDPDEWRLLAEQILPKIIAERPQGRPIRIWSAGCSSGEEPYSLAILLAEALGPQDLAERVKVFATDIDEEALARARQATYSRRAVEFVAQPLLERYFEQVGERYLVRGDLRRLVVFGRQDLLRDPPISHLDLLICRNVLIYFAADAQARLVTAFHQALDAGGYLFVGKAEVLIGGERDLFAPGDGTPHIYQRLPRAGFRERLKAMAAPGSEQAMERLGLYVRLREMSFDSMPTAEIVVDQAGQLVLANERARGLFGLTYQDIGRPFQDLEISYRPAELRAPIERAYREGSTVDLDDVVRHLPGDRAQHFAVRVVPLANERGRWGGVLILFDDVTRRLQLRQDLERSRQDLETAYEELQSGNEELTTTNEELQSTVEELETTNEELQSANEELETLNEEMQSSNQEMETVNSELRQRTDDYNQANDFLQASLGSVGRAIVAVDRKMDILLWNRVAEGLWGPRGEEVRGSSLVAVDMGLPVDQLVEPLRAVLGGSSEREERRLAAVDRRGRHIQVQVTISPLLWPEKSLGGAVLLMEVQQ